MDTSKILTILCVFILIVCLTLCITSLVTLRNAIDENEAVQTAAMNLVTSLDECMEELQEAISKEQSISVSVSPDTDETMPFLVRATENGIGIYSSDGYLIREINVPIHSLPQQDRLLLEKGVEVKSWGEIIQYLQDYHE